MNDLDELTRYLQARADAADLGHTPVRVITRAGTRRRARHRAVTAAGVVVVGAATGVATLQVLRDDGGNKHVTMGPVVPDAGPTATEAIASTAPTLPAPATEAAPAASLVEPPLVWNQVTVGSAEAVSSFGVVGDLVAVSRQPDGSFAQISSAPGRSQGLGPMLYRSDDAIAWAADETAIFDGRLTPLAVDGDRLYTVSTGAATVEPVGDRNDYFAVSSRDGGQTWDSARLELDTALWAKETGIGIATFYSRSAAVYGQTVVLAGAVGLPVDASTYAERLGLDASTLSPDPETGGGVIARETSPIDCDELSASSPVATDTNRGLMLPGTRLEDGTCVAWGSEIARYSPTDLALPPEATAAIVQGLPVLFRSDDGARFERVAPPTLPKSFTVRAARVIVGPNGFMLSIAGLAHANDDQDSALLFTSTDGLTWNPLPELPSTSCGVVGVGFVGESPVVTTYGCDGSAGALVLRDGVWTTPPALDVRDPDERPVMSLAAVGNQGIAIVTQLGRPTTDQGAPTDGGFDPSSIRWVLLFSPDGSTWSTTELSDVTSMASQRVTAVRVTDGAVHISVAPRSTPDAPLPDVTVLVGTLA